MQDPNLPAGITDADLDNSPCLKCDTDTYDEDGEAVHTAICPTLQDPDDYQEDD